MNCNKKSDYGVSGGVNKMFLTVKRITLVYIILGSLWIALSDRALSCFASDSKWLPFFNTIKGWFFIAVTAAVLYVLIARYTRDMTASENKYRQVNEELTAANEELVATEEEIRQQFDELLSNDEKIRRQNEYLAALHETALALMNELERDNLLRTIVQRAVLLSQAQNGSLFLLDRETNEMKIGVRVGLDIEREGFRQKKGDGVVGRVWDTGQYLVVDDYSAWEGRLKDAAFDVIKVSAGFPLKAQNEVIGVLGVSYSEPYVLNDVELKLMLSFAELASIAIQNAQLNCDLRDSEVRSRALIEALPDVVFRLDKEGTLLAYEPGKDFVPLYNLTGKIGENLRELLPVPLGHNVLLHVQQALATGVTQQFEYEYDSGGKKKYREARVLAIGSEQAIGIIRDITERREMEDRLKYMALHDSVTGLYNRVYFEEELNRLNKQRRLSVGIIVCDIDGLKLVNDTLGHREGDRLLASVAKMIKSCFGEECLVARIGGDEFAVLMPAGDYAEVEQACRAIRTTTSTYCEANPQLPFSISIGMSMTQDGSSDLNEVFKAADDSMYREKLHRAQSVRSAIVSTLAKALEARDFVTDGHADRLQDLVEALAVAVGVPEHDISDLRLLARFHDVGKVGIPDSILFKPDRLTHEEFEIMKRHCEIGYRIALASSDLTPIADWILKHQEWWNGQGYPLGLHGEEIPLACRILALADAYDAMTNDRPYRKALPQEQALEEIARCAGAQFDPYLAGVFIKTIRAGLSGR